MNTRVKELRTYLKLTQEKFGEKLGVKKAAINKIEKGENNITPQMFNSICREFNVNPDWLRDGILPMINDLSENEELEYYFSQLSSNINSERKELLKAICKLSDEQWEVLKSIISALKIEDVEKEDTKGSADAYDNAPDTPQELEKAFPPINDSDAGTNIG